MLASFDGHLVVRQPPLLLPAEHLAEMMARMNGHELLTALALRPEIGGLPVVVVSAYRTLALAGHARS